MLVDRIELPPSHPVTEAYMSQSDPRVAELFGSHPGEAEAWRERMAWLENSANQRADRKQTAGVLRTYNERLGLSPAIEANLTALEQGAPVIVGGQQAGLFTGPVMVIHKAISIIQAARWAEEATGKRVVPVFWIAGEDHDWAEANHAFIVRGDGGLHRIAVERDEYPRTSVSRTKLSRGILQDALQELAETLPDSAHKAELLDKLESAIRRSDTLSDQFAAMLASLFAKEGLVLMDADDPNLRRIEGPMFARLIESGQQLEEAYRENGARLEAMGYPLQVESQPDCANLFVFRDERLQPGAGRLAGERVLMYRRDGRYADRKGTLVIEREKLLQLAAEAPELLSNNVLTRPLMQDYVLPVLATVLGPGEIAYWAQTSDAFRALDMRMPIVLPRMSFTMMDESLKKRMAAFDLTLDDVKIRLDERKSAWLAQQGASDLDARFEEAEQGFSALYQPLLDELAELDGGLGTLGQRNRERIIEQIRYLHRKTQEAYQLRHEADLRRFDYIAAWLHPDGKPQERVISWVALWNRHGRHWLDSLMAVPYDRLGGNYLVHL
jgi:bacillithiol synthase